MATNKRKGIMLAYPFEESRLAKWKAPYIVQPKLDGERCRVTFDGYATLLSSTEELVTGVPNIADAMEFVQNQGLDLPELDGELYCHGMDQNQIHSIVSRKYMDTIHPAHEKIKLFIFDVITGDPQLARVNYVEGPLAMTLKDCPCVEIVPSYVAHNYEDVVEYYNTFIEMGYEGIIVRDMYAPYVRRRATTMMKFKEKRTDTYRVVRFEEAISQDGEAKGMVGAIVCVDEMGTEFKVGAGRLSHMDRKMKWAARPLYVGGLCTVGYQNLTAKNKVPRSGMCITIELNRGE